AVAKDVVALDNDVAEIDTDAEPDAPFLGQLRLAVEHAALDFGRTAHRVDDTGEFHQHTVPGGFDDAAATLGDLWVDQFPAQRVQASQRALFIGPHQT